MTKLLLATITTTAICCGGDGSNSQCYLKEGKYAMVIDWENGSTTCTADTWAALGVTAKSANLARDQVAEGDLWIQKKEVACGVDSTTTTSTRGSCHTNAILDINVERMGGKGLITYTHICPSVAPTCTVIIPASYIRQEK